jgi:hypothetical protein
MLQSTLGLGKSPKNVQKFEPMEIPTLENTPN